MKSFPQLTLDFDPLIHILYGAMPAKLLLTAIKLNVFSHLTEALTADSLAHRIGTHPENTRVLLDALAANELLRKRNGRYRNTPVADTFLVEDLPTYLGAVLTNLAEWMRPALEDLTALVKDGPPPPGEPMQPSCRAQETEVYANYQRAGRAQQAAAMVSELPELSRMKKMLDLGGGAGLIGLAIVASHPTMTGVIFDRPEVVEVGQRFIREYELEDRVVTIGGDFVRDAIGEGYDLVWTSFALRRGDLDGVLRKIHGALNPGGVCISLAEGLTHECTRPTLTINSMVSVNLCSRVPLYQEGEIAQAMLRAGFRSVHSRVPEGPQPHGPAVVDIARR
jgi:predicted O-methyltransferase YrrM